MSVPTCSAVFFVKCLVFFIVVVMAESEAVCIDLVGEDGGVEEKIQYT